MLAACAWEGYSLRTIMVLTKVILAVMFVLAVMASTVMFFKDEDL